VAIIGAGPAGISCACELRLHGYTVDIFEEKELPSGLTVYGVAPYKITNSEALDEMAYLEKQFGYSVYYGKRISTREDIEKLEQNYDAVFLGIGLSQTADLGIPGEDLQGVTGAVEFIAQLRMDQHKVRIPNKVIVLGGGNTAMDAASESARMGAESVILAYRRSKEEMGAYDFEYDLVKGAGVSSIFNVAPLELISQDGKSVSGVRFIRTQAVKGKMENIEGTEFVESCDGVIKATGQQKQISFSQVIDGLALNPNGTIVVNKSFQTQNQKYFAAGDVVSGGQEVVHAVADGKKAAQGIIYFLNF
jgi:glutamate synthase (NADPH/NADH) small chain